LVDHFSKILIAIDVLLGGGGILGLMNQWSIKIEAR